MVAHAQHGRLDLVEELSVELPHRLERMLTHPVANPPPYLMELPISGGLLLALAMVDLDRGARTGDERATMSGVRMIALAERFRFRGTTSPPCPRQGPARPPSRPIPGRPAALAALRERGQG